MKNFFVIPVIIFITLIFSRKKKVTFKICKTDSDCINSICGRQNVCEHIRYE